MERFTFLPWDSDFFDKRVASLGGERLTPDILRSLDAWCAEQEIDCLYFLADPDDLTTTTLAVENGFRLVDIRVRLEAELSRLAPASLPDRSPIRAVCEDDIDELANSARGNHTDTRFFFDPNFPAEASARLYETWLRNSCSGYADAVFVADEGGRPAGYVTCHLGKDGGAGEIGLMGVSPEARGRGVGTALVLWALDWFKLNGVGRVRVVTQGRNYAAQRLYQRCGFATESIKLWYHRWAPLNVMSTL